MAVVTYNGYEFPDYAHLTVALEMIYDEAGRTVVSNRYKFHVQAIILGENSETNAGDNFRRARQRLTKAGQTLRVEQLGFSPSTLLVNAGSGGVRDVEFGPKPTVLAWNPVGNENAVEIVWDCETCIPSCDGDNNVRFEGVSSINYSVSTRIDETGFSERTVSGYIEIAMTRIGRSLPDTADAYREVIVIDKPPDYERTSNWELSADKRRLTFSIVDRQIRSPNSYPPGVLKIEADHESGFSVRDRVSVPSTISARIVLAPNIYRGYAWEVFRQIVVARIAYAGPKAVFFQSLRVREGLYDYTINFELQYKTFVSGVQDLFVYTGAFTNLANNWVSWEASSAPFQSPRGISNLRNLPSDDQIVDLCSSQLLPGDTAPYNVISPPQTTYQPLCNEKPYPAKSWLHFEGTLVVVDNHATVHQITMGKDDLQKRDFNPSDIGGIGSNSGSAAIERFIESAPSYMQFEWRGYAQRVGYEIQMPDKLVFGDVTLIKSGEQKFAHRFLGEQFCQPVYEAAWAIRYVVAERPSSASADEADPVYSPSSTGTSSSIAIPSGA